MFILSSRDKGYLSGSDEFRGLRKRSRVHLWRLTDGSGMRPRVRIDICWTRSFKRPTCVVPLKLSGDFAPAGGSKHHSINRKPNVPAWKCLRVALAERAEAYNANIVLWPTLRGSKLLTVETKLINVPVETAVETLARMVDLRAVTKGNVFYVTTKEKAAELNTEEAKNLASKRRKLKQEIAELERLKMLAKEKDMP